MTLADDLADTEWELPDKGWGEARKFAAERSHGDAKEAAINGRTTANAALLINGAALTAVITYVASTNNSMKLTPLSYALVTAVSLVCYLLGVIFATLSQFFNTKSSVEWLLHWQVKAQRPSETSERNERYEKGRAYSKRAEDYFLVGLCCFIVGSIAFSFRLLGIAIQLIGSG